MNSSIKRKVGYPVGQQNAEQAYYDAVQLHIIELGDRGEAVRQVEAKYPKLCKAARRERQARASVR